MKVIVSLLIGVLMTCSAFGGENGSNTDMAKVADCLLSGDLGSAEKLLKNSAGEDEEWNSFKKSVEQVLTMPDLIWKAYAPLKGKITTVYLKSGKKKLLIKTVTRKEIKAVKQLVSGGRVVGTAENNFTYEDLCPREKIMRLGKGQSPELNIMRGILACSAGVPDKAVPFFEKAGDGLGKMLIECLKKQNQEKSLAADKQAKDKQEAAAERNFKDMLKIVTVRYSGQPQDELFKSVRSKKLSQTQVDMVRRSSKLYFSRHAASDFSAKYSKVIGVMDQLVAGMPLSVESAVVDKAIADLRGLYPNLELKIIVKHDQEKLEISLTDNKLVDNITPLKGLPITVLNLSGTHISDLSPLQGMPLSVLHLNGCGFVRDLSPLKGMPLVELDIGGACHNNFDLMCLKGLPLKKLYLPYHYKGSIDALRGLPLTDLNIIESHIKDLSALNEMPLKKLDLRSSFSLSDISPLKGLPLEVLTLSGGWKIEDLSPLKGVPLENLNLSGCSNIKDLSPLEGSKTLKFIDIRGTSVKDVSPLRSIKELKVQN